MWILLNNQPVCVFNIKNVTGIMNITPEIFYYDTRVSSGGTVSYIYSDAYTTVSRTNPFQSFQ